jgi:hypothetical protein
MQNKKHPQGEVEYSEQVWNPSENKWEWYTRVEPNPTEGEGWSFTPAR